MLTKGDPVIVEIEDSTGVAYGNPSWTENRPYRLSFNRERCEWTAVGPMTYQNPPYGLVENHRRIYGPLIEKPFLSREEVRSGGECVQPTSGRIYFIGIPLKFDGNGTLNGQTMNPAKYGPITVPKRAGHLSLPTSAVP